MRGKWHLRFDWWKEADLATRIASVSTLLASIPLLFVLVVSVATIKSFLWSKVEADLRLASHLTLLRFEHRIDQAVSSVEMASKHAIFSNALLDAGDIERYAEESLGEICMTMQDILAVELVDFQGETLSRGCRHEAWQVLSGRDLAVAAIERGSIMLEVVNSGERLSLLIAAPIRFRPTGSMEGALISEISLTSIFAGAVAPSERDLAWRLRYGRGNKENLVSLHEAKGRLTFSRRILPVRDIDLDLVVDLSIDKQGVYRSLYGLLAGVGALFAICLYALVQQSRKIALWVVHPINELEKTAKLVTAGAFDLVPTTLALPQGNDHLSQLTRNIHRMIVSLKESQERLSLRLDERAAQIERIEADRRLKELALASSDSGVIILRRDESLGVKRIHYANDAFFSITGFSPEEMIDATWPDVLFKHCKTMTDEGDTVPSANELPPVLIFTRRDSKRVFLSLTTSKIIGADDQKTLHRVVIVSDVSDRIRAEYAHRVRLESLREIVFESDLDGCATFLNGAWQSISGYSVQQCIGKRLLEFIHPDDLQVHREKLRQIGQSELSSYAFEARLRTKDGELRWLRINTGALKSELGQVIGFSGTMADVTKQHEASVALTLRDRALQAASNGIVITSIETPDCPIIYVNPAFERITGYSLAEAQGLDCRFLQANDRGQPEVALLRKAIAEHKACQVTFRNYRKNGEMFWNQLDIAPVCDPISGEVTHYVGVQADITDRKRSEDTLVEWLSRLDAIFTLSPDPIVCFDSNGRLSYANTAAERIFQTSLGALNELSIKEFYEHVRVHSAVAPEIEDLIPPGGEQDGVFENPAAAPNSIIELDTPVRRILQQTYRYCGSTSTSLVLYFRDITRERELDRMKSDFLSTAAHELRTPMASIMGFSELLLMRKYDEERTHELLATINRQALRLTNLLTDLLDLARIEARRAEGLHFEWLPLCPMLDDTLDAFLTPEGREPTIRQWACAGIEVRADRGKFQQAVMNLLSNAYKFSPEGGEVRVSIIATDPSGASRVGVEVRDDGIGLSEEDQKHMFERFYRSDRSGHIPGTGLGLPLVKEIMTVHGGDVTVESSFGNGTSVILWFPARKPTSGVDNEGVEI